LLNVYISNSFIHSYPFINNHDNGTHHATVKDMQNVTMKQRNYNER